MELPTIARELRAARDNLGLSREQLAEKIGYTASYVEKIETGKLAATEPYIAAAATTLAEGIDATELFGRLRADERKEVLPGWFRPWFEYEQEATLIRTYESSVVPGLLQTEEYARALTGSDEVTAMRLERQRVLSGDKLELVTIVAEVALATRVGTREVMHDQLVRLTNQPPSVSVQVLPAEADTYLGLDGPFALATVDGHEVVYVDTPARGFVLDDPGLVSATRSRWDALRGEALPHGHSRRLILEAAERWKS